MNLIWIDPHWSVKVLLLLKLKYLLENHIFKDNDFLLYLCKYKVTWSQRLNYQFSFLYFDNQLIFIFCF